MKTLNTDGASRGNPGISAVAFVIKDEAGKILKQGGGVIGLGTNNSAEYKALITGLQEVVKMNIDEIACYLDSELVVKQLNGLYKVKNADIAVLFREVKDLENKFGKILYTHVLRSKNFEADALGNYFLDNYKNDEK